MPDKESFREMLLKRIHNRLPNDGYSISNKAGPVAEVRIYSEIGFWGVSAADFVAELDEVTAPQIVVAINSLGGDVFDGIAIYNALRLKEAHITTRVDSMAASIASVIAQAGDHRQMVKSSQMMIHEAWGLAIGTSKDMRSLADQLDRQTDVIAEIYAERSGEDVAHFRGLMVDESWFTDKETLDEGLTDEIIKPVRRNKDGDPEAKLRKKVSNQEGDGEESPDPATEGTAPQGAEADDMAPQGAEADGDARIRTPLNTQVTAEFLEQDLLEGSHR